MLEIGHAVMPEVKVLGNLEILKNDRAFTPSAPMVRRVLALLAFRANKIVPVESFIEELWDDNPPKCARMTVRSYIYQLRKMFISEGLRDAGEELLITRVPGYLLRLTEYARDLDTFERLAAVGRAELDRGHPHRAAELLSQALDLWTGRTLANVSLGRILHAHVVNVEELRLRALELRIQADLRLGRHREITGELRSLVATHPLNEWFHSRLIIALANSGRRYEALQAYQNVHALLKDELGLDPSPDLQQLQYELLTTGRVRSLETRFAVAS